MYFGVSVVTRRKNTETLFDPEQENVLLHFLIIHLIKCDFHASGTVQSGASSN